MTTVSASPVASAKAHVTVGPDGTAEVEINGDRAVIQADSVASAREIVREQLISAASRLRRDVVAVTAEPDGRRTLRVHPDGQLDESMPASAGPARPPAQREQSSPAPAPNNRVAADTATVAVAPRNKPSAAVALRTETTDDATSETDDSSWEELLESPAADGRRGSLNRLLGTTFAPSRRERTQRREALERERAAEVENRRRRRLVQTNFQGARTLVIANAKGGARKTTTTYLLGATMGMIRGGGVIAWDANETMGNLGERARQDVHARTVVDLLEEAAASFASIEGSRIGALDRYVRTQGDCHFDVLASDEDATRQRIVDEAGFTTVHEILSRFYRLILVDTGNNIRTGHFLAAIDQADQLVIPVATSKDSRGGAERLIQALRERGHAGLVDRAVMLVHELDAEGGGDAKSPYSSARIARDFEQEVAAVVPIPFDGSLKYGDQVDYEHLSPALRDAYENAAAAIALSMRRSAAPAG